MGWITPLVLDTDAANLITAANISNITVINAVNTVIISSKTNGWWDLCNGIYGMAGDNINQTYAFQYKYNWKDPRDLDAAYRLVFNGTITQDANGITGNGASGSYADTFIAPNILSQDSAHISVYIRTDVQEAKYDIGSYNPGSNYISAIASRYSGNVNYDSINSGTANEISASNSDSRGYFLSNRTASNSNKGYKNATEVASGTVASVAPASSPNFLLCSVGGLTATHCSSKNIAFATFGASLTPTQITNMYTDIQNFQTALGRQV